MKRFGKRIIAVFLSLILAVGMLWERNLVEVKAAYVCRATLELNIVGYEGEGTPEFGEVFLRLYRNRDDNNDYIDIGQSELTVSGSGTNLVYSYVFDGGTYYSLRWNCRCPDGQEMYLNNHTVGDGYGFIGDTKDETSNLGKTLYRIRFMDGDGIYYERYSEYGHYLNIKNNKPQKEQHTFRGWSVEQHSDKVVDYSMLFSVGTHFNGPTTYYAVWRHPAEDTWAWNNDSDSHWHECSCGELKTAAELHTWDDGVITRQPTDTLEGEKTYTCTDGCGRTRTEPISATGKPTVSGNDSISGNDPTLPDNPSTPGNSDIPANTPDAGTNNVNTGNTVNNGTPVKAVANVSTTSTKNKEPKTGGVPYIEIYATVAMIAGMAYLLLYFYDDKRGMSETEKKELMAQLIAWAKKGGYFRRMIALTAIFFLLCYYHSIGKQSQTQWKIT